MKFEKEIKLYKPVKNLLEAGGYEVKAEIHDCDVMGLKDEKMLAVELKLRLNMDVLIQATDRQKTADLVYIAVPAQRHSKRTEKIKYMLKRLEIGLIYVGTDGTAKVIFDTVPFDMAACKARYKKRREMMEKEFGTRLGDLNTGGSTGKTLMTAYRQNALQIVGILHETGSASAVDIKKSGGCENTYGIIHDNHYGWFEKIDRGIYSLSELGQAVYIENTEFIKGLNEKIRKFRAEDIDAVMKIWLDSNIDAHGFISREYWQSNYDSVREMIPQADVFVYECGVILGFIGVVDGCIAGIFVKSEARSHGIGKKLLDYTKGINKKLTLEVYKNNNRAFEFYLREEFKAIEEKVDENTGEAEYLMEFIQ